MLHTAKAALFALGSMTLAATASAVNLSFPSKETLKVPLNGQAVLNFAHPSGGTGDPDASGRVTLVVEPAKRRVCYDFAMSGVSTPIMAFIHQGSPLSNGPPIVALFTGPGGRLDGCARANTGQLADMILYPSHYYVTVATVEFPDGALRGQLG